MKILTHAIIRRMMNSLLILLIYASSRCILWPQHSKMPVVSTTALIFCLQILHTKVAYKGCAAIWFVMRACPCCHHSLNSNEAHFLTTTYKHPETFFSYHYFLSADFAKICLPFFCHNLICFFVNFLYAFNSVRKLHYFFVILLTINLS